MERDAAGRLLPTDPVRRFWAQVEKTDDCWAWTGPDRMGKGDRYGRFYVGLDDRKRLIRVPVHRYALLLAGRPVPDDLTVDHLCRNTLCVRVDHLEVVTARENNLRSDSPSGLNARKTHCKWGHEFTPENTYIATNQKYPRRQCITCRREQMLRWLERKRRSA